MRLRKNVVPLGAARVCFARGVGEEVEFFLGIDGTVVRKVYNLRTRSLKTDSQSVALAHAFVPLCHGAVQDLGEIVYVKEN